MKQFLTALLMLCLLQSYAQTNSNKKRSTDTTHVPNGPGEIPVTGTDGGDDNGDSDDKKNILEPLLAYNFSGGNKNLSNLTPVIQYGWSKLMKGKWTLSVNPYAAGQIDVKDSVNMVPGLMLPGIAGLKVNNYLSFPALGGQFIWSPLNFGLKMMTNYLDSTQVLMQHNLRTGIGFSYQDYFQVGVQYTMGWHNATSESEKHFKNIFKSDKTKIKYLTIVFETYLKKEVDNSSLLYFEWRGLLNKDDFKELPNSKILTIGFRKEFSLDNLLPAASPKN